MSKIKCPRKNKHCQPALLFDCKGGNFICSGINDKPTKYKGDKIWLCLSGALCKRSLEMTPEEASFMIAALATSLGNQFPAIKRKQK